MTKLTSSGCFSGSLEIKTTDKIRDFRGRGTDRDMKGSKVTETYQIRKVIIDKVGVVITLLHSGQTKVDLNWPPKRSTKNESFLFLYKLHD